MRNQIFFSYSHKDRKWLEMFQTALKPLVRGKSVSVWDDSKIKSGDVWRDEIKNALASAKVAVLLVSPDFLASDFIASDELPPLLEAARTDGLTILWVAVRHSLYRETEIARYQAVNDPARPLASLKGSSRDGELVKICLEIKSAAGAGETRAAHGKGESLPVEKTAAPAPEVADRFPAGEDTPREPRGKDLPREPRGVEDPAENSAPTENTPKAPQPVEHATDVPGDLLTLAEEAPTPTERAALLWRAAEVLYEMRRFGAALAVLEDLLELDPKHTGALTRIGIVLMRLGWVYEAKLHLLKIAKEFEGDAEAQGIAGRAYKDLWRLKWKDLGTLEERQRQAVATSRNAARAVHSYNRAARKNFDYYHGVNVVSLVKLLEHLRAATGEEPADFEIDDLDVLASTVRRAARNTLHTAVPGSGPEAVWATATLGELELVAGDATKARMYYRDAANAPNITYFQVNSMLEQVCLFESLAFRPETVAAVKEYLEQMHNFLVRRMDSLGKSGPRFGKVVAFSGHMIDAPDRIEKGLGERFPPRKERAVRAALAAQLEAWNVGAGDLAICGGAQGGDILFAELCAERGADVWLMLALYEHEFVEKSVRPAGGDWESRFYALWEREGVNVFEQSERLESPPEGASVFARNNLWMLNTARVEADDPQNLHAVLVWDEQPTGDGPGGTSDFAARTKQLGGRLAPVINPTKL